MALVEASLSLAKKAYNAIITISRTTGAASSYIFLQTGHVSKLENQENRLLILEDIGNGQLKTSCNLWVKVL